MTGAKQKWVCGRYNLFEGLKELEIGEHVWKAWNNKLFGRVFEKMKEAGIHRTIHQIKHLFPYARLIRS